MAPSAELVGRLTDLGILPAGTPHPISVPLQLLYQNDPEHISNDVAERLIELCDILIDRGIDLDRLWRTDDSGIVHDVMRREEQQTGGFTLRYTSWIHPQLLDEIIARADMGLYDTAPASVIATSPVATPMPRIDADVGADVGAGLGAGPRPDLGAGLGAGPNAGPSLANFSRAVIEHPAIIRARAHLGNGINQYVRRVL